MKTLRRLIEHWRKFGEVSISKNAPYSGRAIRACADELEAKLNEIVSKGEIGMNIIDASEELVHKLRVLVEAGIISKEEARKVLDLDAILPK